MVSRAHHRQVMTRSILRHGTTWIYVRRIYTFHLCLDQRPKITGLGHTFRRITPGGSGWKPYVCEKPSRPVRTGWLGFVAEDVGFEPTRVLLPARVPGV